MIYKKALICKTKNLFSTSTEVGTLSGWNQPTARQFEEGKWYVGLTNNNYYLPGNIFEYELTENSIYVNTKGNGYGITRAFKCESDTHYVVSWIYGNNTTDKNEAYVGIGYYDESGTYLAAVTSARNVTNVGFTTPANCKWFTVDFTSLTPNSLYVSNLQLEQGSTATNYVPYGYLQSYKRAIKVSDICQLLDKSQYPATQTVNGITFTNNGDGSYTVNGTISKGLAVLTVARVSNLIVGHKYYSSSSEYANGIYIETKIERNNANTIWASNMIREWAENDKVLIISLLVDSSKVNTVENAILRPQLFDLTEMYGAGNEPTTVAEFRQKFPNDLYPYRPYCFVDSYKSTVICKTKNLFNKDAESQKGYYTESGSFVYHPPFNCFTIDITENTGYCRSTSRQSAIKGIITFWNNDTFVSSVNKGEGTKVNFITPSGVNKLKIVVEAKYLDSDIQLEQGSTATSYVPYGHL